MSASQSGKFPHRARRSLTGHGTARPDSRHPQQIVRQFIEFDTARRPLVNHFTVAQPVASARSQSASSPAALNSP